MYALVKLVCLIDFHFFWVHFQLLDITIFVLSLSPRLFAGVSLFFSVTCSVFRSVKDELLSYSSLWKE